MEFNFSEIEKKWLQQWENDKVYQVANGGTQPKYYVLEMFPYPSGAGLHVGHPLGYIASDIFARYKRLKGFNVLHPMGFDAFGLPAEQYAIETGQHPAVTTEQNISRYKEQLKKIGLSYDWSREFRTSDPTYYKWTQWIFLQIFNSWYNPVANKAEPISTLINIFDQEGNSKLKNQSQKIFTAAEWKLMNEKEQADVLMNFRLAYLADATVNWCEALGTVLANDEVVNGVSERGGHPVVKKKMRQWFLRITAYADRLLEGLEKLDWSDAMKEQQKNWIGRSEGAAIQFKVENADSSIEVFTTRPDTIFGCSFMVLAPEHELVNKITTTVQKAEVEKYVQWVKSRSEVERMAEKKISGAFTGAFALHPFTGEKLPIWISEYVLAGYGTGAIMAVPCGDSRDYAFAKYFGLAIPNIFDGKDISEKAYEDKDAVLCNSDLLNGKNYTDALPTILNAIEDKNIGTKKVNYKLRDAGFSRQRYWGEPFPIYYENGIARALDEKELPLLLPHVQSYSPGPEGQGPLANIPEWTARNLETNTMPGYAGSSWYFLRYMSPHEDKAFVNEEAMKYWGAVDFYNGGSEHAVGHLLYSRLWTKILFDLGKITFDEPFKKMVNQGMIQGSSRLAYRIEKMYFTNKEISGIRDIREVTLSDYSFQNIFISANKLKVLKSGNSDEANNILSFIGEVLNEDYSTYNCDKIVESPIRANVSFVDGIELDVERFKTQNQTFSVATYLYEEDGKFLCDVEVEKMSKRWLNVVNPDDVIAQYGADCFRMYEMFLGPITDSKPWDTKGIEGVSRFLKKLWNLFYTENGWAITQEAATAEELKVLHKTLKKIEEDINRLSLNTCVSQFMICVNELGNLKCRKREILEPLLIALCPFAPFTTEELWRKLGNEKSITIATYPKVEEKYLVESSFNYPIAFNGKAKLNIELALDLAADAVQKTVLENESVQKIMAGTPLKKFIFVKGKMVNIVM